MTSRVVITYGARKSERGGWAPFILVNGKSLWLNVRNRKTQAGALKKAKAVAEYTAVCNGTTAVHKA